MIGHPSFLTPALIAAAEGTATDARTTEWIRILKDVWLEQERARELFKQLLKLPFDPSARLNEIWLEAEVRTFLALRETKVVGHDYSVVLIPGQVLEQAFLRALAETRSQLPSYMDVSVQVGQRRWPVVPNGWTIPYDSPASNVLATADAGMSARPDLEPIPEGAKEYKLLWYLAPPDSLAIKFTINLELGRPELLYARYRQRLWLAVGLVLSATAAAGIGLAGAWRAFRRQERLAEMTSNFVSSVSHELRAPLASVRLMAESLDQGRIENVEKQKEYFRLIGQECSRLSSLVENVLDFSRIHQGRKRYEFEPTDLAALIRQTVRLMEPGASARDVNLLLSELPAGCEELQPSWDGQAVQQALVNLIDNAIKHSPAGSQVIVACETAGKAEDAVIRVSVSDQGQGIPDEERERIFEPFYRSGVELRRETRGIGIGLSIVKHVAEAHGGRITLESSPGQGSRFTMELPADSRSEKAGGGSPGQ